jgi:hypothetical protein
VAKWPFGALQPVKKGRLKRPKIANTPRFLNLTPLILFSKGPAYIKWSAIIVGSVKGILEILEFFSWFLLL